MRLLSRDPGLGILGSLPGVRHPVPGLAVPQVAQGACLGMMPSMEVTQDVHTILCVYRRAPTCPSF